MLFGPDHLSDQDVPSPCESLFPTAKNAMLVFLDSHSGILNILRTYQSVSPQSPRFQITFIFQRW